MYTTKTVILNKDGFHARPVLAFVNIANEFDCDIQISSKGRVANTKSINSVMSLDLDYGDEIIIVAVGVDEEKAVIALEEYIKSCS